MGGWGERIVGNILKEQMKPFGRKELKLKLKLARTDTEMI